MNAQQKEQIKWVEKLKGNVLEIGVCRGATTELFCHAVQKHDGTVIAVDPLDNEDYYNSFKENILDKYKIEFHRTRSQEALNIIKTRFKYAYIDGSHTYEDCLSDLTNVYQSIQTGGVACLDDTNLDDVKMALDEVLKAKMYKIIKHNSPVEHKEYVMLKVLK